MERRMERLGARPDRPAPSHPRPPGWLNRSLAAFVTIGLACAAGAIPAVQARPIDGADPSADSVVPKGPPETPRHPREKTYLKRQWGVEVMNVRETAAGTMLEFRYKVVDAEKARPLFERQTKPVLTHAETGAQLVVPTPAKTGALRNSNLPIDGKVYWMFFANPGRLVRQGDHVSIEIGEFRVDGLVVQ